MWLGAGISGGVLWSR